MNILSLGEKIKKLRKEKNMTLKELAGDRITAAQISHIERDKSHTSHELLEYLASKLGVSIDYLLETKEMQSKRITDNLVLQSEIYIKYGDLEKAEEQILEVIAVCKEYSLYENYGKCNLLLADINLKKEDYSLAVVYFEKALYYFIKNNDRLNIINCHANIGDIYVKDKFYKGALSHYHFSEEVLIESDIEDTNIYISLFSKIANCYSKIGNHEVALKYIEKADKLDTKDNTQEEIEILIMKANGYLSTNRYDESRQNFEKALELIEEEENKTYLAQMYLEISNVYTNVGNDDKSLEYSQKAYDIKKNDEDEVMMQGLFNIVKSYIKSDDYELAKKYCKLALMNSIKLKSKKSEYESLKLYSSIHKSQEEYEMAIEYLNKCLRILNQIGDKECIAKLYLDLGQLYSNISKEKELEYYQKGVSMYKELNII